MGLVSPALGTLGGQRGDGEAADRNALATLLAEFNGNIDSANMKNAPLVLLQTLTAQTHVQVDGATWAQLRLRHTAAGVNLKRSAVYNAGGHTKLIVVDDADTAILRTGLDMDHASGVVDFPNGLSIGGVAGSTGLLASPYFRAYRNAAASYADGATVLFDTETDPNGWYNPATGIFLPTIAGTYRLSWAIALSNVSVLTTDEYLSTLLVAIGTVSSPGSLSFQRGASKALISVGSALLPFNGSTDQAKVVLSTDHVGALALDIGAQQRNHFEAHRVGT